MTRHRRTQIARRFDEVDIDCFAGAGGASSGIEEATGVPVFAAINHCEHAVEIHALNHPQTRHYREDVFMVKPRDVVGSRRVRIAWFSPDCKHHSRAKGGKPRDQKIRGLAWVARDWARDVRPRIICLENVPEFESWGPLDENGNPIPERAGETFEQLVGELRAFGYSVEWRNLVACDYGSPQRRKRLFMIARSDGEPIMWPEPTHGPGLARPHRTARGLIDWSIPNPSIFGRKRELSPKTEARIAEGIRRYVLGGEGTPVVGARPEFVPILVQSGYGERKGQRPRVLDIDAPLGTVVACGQKHALAGVFITKHNTGVYGQPLAQPLGTVTAIDHHGLVGACIVRHFTWASWQGIDAPLGTVTTNDKHRLITCAMNERRPEVDAWLARHGLPVGSISDVTHRMLDPLELARAQDFRDDYIFTGCKTDQIARIGNAVCRRVARAIVRAQLRNEIARAA